jgi:chloramphenicol 3-O phosphotransferase
MILDEVFLAGGCGQERIRQALDGSDFLWVGVHCDPDLAEQRESRRSNRRPGMARQQALSVHAGVIYDLEVNTTYCSTEQCAQDIAARIHR